MTEQVILQQLRDGTVILGMIRNSGARTKLRLTPDDAQHLAYRLLSFATSQHMLPEMVLEKADA
jgi:hypothetical protein